MYPNPSNGQLTLEFGDDILKPTRLTLINLEGKQMLEKEWDRVKPLIQLDWSHLSKGTCIAIFQQGGHILFKRLVIN